MADIEKVKQGIKACWSEHWFHKCCDCPYKPDRDNDDTCVERLGADALELLKDQKNDKQPKKGHWKKAKYADDRWHQCSECGTVTEAVDHNGYKLICNYCPVCGADMRKDCVGRNTSEMEGQKMLDNNTVYYEENLKIVNQPNKEDQDSLIEMAAQECVMQIAANALGNNHVSVEKKDLGNGKTRVQVSMRLVPPEG